MEITMGSASNLVTGVVGYLFQKIKRNFSYVFHHRTMVLDFEKKVEMLKDKRDRVLLDVDAAQNNGETIYPDVNNWLMKVDDMIISELNKVKSLEDEAKNKCFIGLCPNFKAFYQLSKKAEEDAGAVDELLQQGGFDKISYRDVPQPIVVVPPKDFEDFNSRKLVFNKIMEAVKDPNFNILGVHGMPGVGKTTLVKEVVRQVKEDKLFDSVVMAVVTYTPDVQKIQDQIADMLGLKFEEQSMSGRASRLCQRLKKEKKILVVLDDIWAKLDLMEVGIPLGDKDQVCTILLTSRDRNVLRKDMDAKESFPLGVLTHEEAWNFFKNIARNGVESHDLPPIAIEVAKRCGGLPIAIRTLATSLKNEPPFAWEDALQQLNGPPSSNFKGVPAAVCSSIEWSYDRLPSEEHKQTFLLCGLIGHNALFDELLMYAMGLGLFHGINTVEKTRIRLLTVVSHLKACCLLVDSYSNQRFDMHDLISDVAISIASKGNHVFSLRPQDVLDDWPDDETMKECDKIFLPYGSFSELPDQLKCPKLSFFGIGSKNPLLKIPTNFFMETKNLKVLILACLNLPSLPSSISLLANLRTLCLMYCALGDIALIGELKNLEILNFEGSEIEMLPEEIGQLTKLKWLGLIDCSKLKRIPPGVFCKLSRLEELYMSNSFNEWEAKGQSSQQSNFSLAELKALSCLTSLEIHIPNANIIPKDFSFEKLQRYIIFIGEASHWDWNWVWVRENSRTLKLSLQTSISFLNNGVKVLLKKAENLYIDEVKDVEILLQESEVGDYFRQLKNLHIQNGAMIQYIFKDNDDVDKIEFQLEILELQGLPKLISFCSKNEGSTSTSPQETTLFKQKTQFPKLKELVLSSITIERIWLPQEFCSTQNLTTLIIEGCANLKHVLSDSMVEYLQQLECLEISECKCIHEIISKEKIIKEAFRNRYLICFPRLNSLKLKGLQNLIGFCHEDYTVEFPTLRILEIENCPQLKGFIHNSTSKEILTDVVLFNNKVVFSNLEKITISHLRKVKRVWDSQLHTNSFPMLKELSIMECNVLLNIFPPFLLGAFQRLEKLIVTDCASLEEVFQLQEQGLDIEETHVANCQLREVNLIRLPKLKHVWTKYHKGNISFESLRQVCIEDCWSLKTLFPFSIAKDLQQLERLTIARCGLEEIVSKSVEESGELKICFAFNQLSFLELWDLPDLTCFYPGMHRTTWPTLKQLRIHWYGAIKIFGHEESQIQHSLFLIEKVIPQLEEVSFSHSDIAMISDGQFEADLFCNVKFFRISCYFDESAIFPISFLRRFYNLEGLDVVFCNFKELASFESDAHEDKDMRITTPKIKKLKLDLVNNIRHLWKLDSPLDHICARLECLELWQCDNLINLGLGLSFFETLTTLDVWKCNGMSELITSFKVQSLVCLVTMRIRECEMMREVVASDEGETPYEIVFTALKHLELHCLQRLVSFCSGHYTLRFPSLEQVTLSQCPRMKNFYQGVLSTPKLHKVQLTVTDFKGRWAGDLNATVEQLYKEQVGYRGLKNLKLSDFSELINIWSRNPQEMLDFTTLEFLEVCDSNNLRYIFNLSMVFCLGQLRQMEIKRCNNLEQVIKEEGSITMVEEAITDNSKIIDIFPRLQSIIVESCPNITSFYLGSKGLECPSLLEIKIANCSNMTTLISTFSRDEDKELIIGDEVDNVSTFFSDKTQFPKLKELVLSSISIERIWLLQGFCSTQNLTTLIIEGCDNLKHVLSDSMVEYLQQLECLEISECKCIHEIISMKKIIKEAFGNRYLICFPRLNSLRLKRLEKLIGFCHEDYTVEFPTLKILEIESCPKLEGFIHNSMSKEISTDAIFFNNKVAFPNLEKITISHLRKVKRIWYNQLHTSSFSMLKELTVKDCDVLLNIFPHFLLRVFKRLEKLIVTDCASLEEVFQLQVQGLDVEEKYMVDSQLKEVNLVCLPKLKHVWTKYHMRNISFESLRQVCIQECWSLKTLFPFSIAKDLQQLERLTIDNCGLEEIVSKNVEGSDEQEICFAFNQLSFLMLWHLPYLKCFNPGMHRTTWPALKQLRISGCWKIKIFGHEKSQIRHPLFLIEKVIPQLEEVSFSHGDIAMISDGQFEADLFCNVKFLRISCYSDVSDVFPISFIRRFYNLEGLDMVFCNFKELASFESDACEDKDMTITIPKIKKLKLDMVDNIRHLWKLDSPLDHICASLECLELWQCDNLINLGLDLSFFETLTTLDVWKCNGMSELITSFKAQSLVCLVTIRIRECEMMREVIASDGDETSYEIGFRALKFLELHCLPSLTSFCSGYCTLRFPSLEQVTLSQCPRMNNFYQGVLSTPQLHRVQLTETDFKGRWAGDLNATVEQLYKEQVGYRGLKHLKFSEFPKLIDLWSRNPQEMLDFATLEFLEVCDTNNLRCIFNLSTAFSLGQLRQMEIKRCNNLEQVIKEEGSIRMVEEANTLSIFPHLQSIIVESCPDMTSFYLGSKGLECPSLVEIKVVDCSNMTTFISTFSKDEDIEAIIGDEVESLTTFFSDKVTFPNLEKITISHLRNTKRIWYNQLHTNSFSMLKELTVKKCDVLLNIFPLFLLRVFQRLEKLVVIDCVSLEEVFQLQVQGLDIEETYVLNSQLREMNLVRLPKLKHVWTKYRKGNISFENLQVVCIHECCSLKTLFPFSIAKGLQQLEGLTINRCGVEEIVSKNDEGSNNHEICFAFNQLSFLMLWYLPYLTCFYPGKHRTTWPALKHLRMSGLRIKIFGHEKFQIRHPLFLIEKVIPQLEEVSFSHDDIAMISDGQFEADLFCNVKFLRISCYFDVSVVFPISFLRRFYNLERLDVVSCHFKELASFESDACEDKDLIITIPKIKKLKLDMVDNIRHLWKQDSPLDHICASLECLQLWQCDNLINLGLSLSFFETLTNLDVWKCNGMSELITSFKVQSLVCLVTMRIRECEMMREVVASDDDETSYEIVFTALKHLELHCLQRLLTFCSGNYTLRFPSLEQITLSQCPRMKNFNQGELTTPKLHKVQLTETDFKGRWAGDLDSTVEQLYKEQVGYRGLKHLKFSEFPKLIDLWSRNPQEMLNFATLEFLEVCDTNNLRCIFNLSTAFSLGQLRQMEIKSCSNLEQVIKEEGSITMVEEAITESSKINSIFPRLQSIIVESCPDMTSFYLGSKGLECPSVVEIKVVDCLNMTTFVSTFSRDEDKEAIIGDEVVNVATFFSNKVGFPGLEKVTISYLRNVKRIWYKQLDSKSFSNLKELKAEHCYALLNIFPHFYLGNFLSLEKLTVTDCASLEEVFQPQVQGLDLEEACFVTSKLRQVKLFRLPKLKHVWNKDPDENTSFENLQEIHVQDCWNLKTLFPFSTVTDLQKLRSLIVSGCGVEEIVSKNVEGSNQHEILFEFNQLSFLALWDLPNLVCFYPGMHNIMCPMLKRLTTSWPMKFKVSGNVVSQLLPIGKIIPQLEHISLTTDDIAMITGGQFAVDLFSHIKVLQITEYLNDSAVVPLHFFQRFSNLEKLKMVGCSFKELSPYEGDVSEERDVAMLLPRINELTLVGVDKMTHLWKQGSPFHHICANLETLQVYECGSLISLSCASSSFQNLTTLDVWICEEMVELITSSKAQCLDQLVTLKIGGCEMMREVIASDGDEATYHEIIFKELKCLGLYDLQNLKSFCLGNYTLKFPALDDLTVINCPAMENFCNGALSTPKLQQVLTGWEVRRRTWDLNATIEQFK